MKTSMLILLNKTATLICKLFKKNGSVFPGSLIVPFDKNVLRKVKYPKYVIGVTGSSGKGSTTSLVAHIMKKAPKEGKHGNINRSVYVRKPGTPAEDGKHEDKTE